MQRLQGEAHRLVLCALFAIGGLAATAASAEAAEIDVTTTDDEINSDGDCSLREAIEAASNDTAADACVAGSGADIIKLPAGTYVLTLTTANEDGNQTGDLDIVNTITIQGGGAGSTVIDGNGADRVLHVLSTGDLTLLDMTVRNGRVTGASANGGGILNNGTLDMTRVDVEDNVADGTDTNPGGQAAGGGIYNFGGLTMVDCSVTGNAANGGNGGLGDGGDAVGGGIYNGDTMSLSRSTIANNSATGGTSTSAVAGDAMGGGLIDQSGIPLLISSSTFSGNSASASGAGLAQGGGIHAGDGLSIELTTIAGNSADAGGGIYSSSTADDSGSVLKAVLIADNGGDTGPDVANRVQSRGYNLIEDTSDATIDDTGNGNTATGNITGVDPQLFALADNGGPTDTHAFDKDSIVIDAGVCTDLAGATVVIDQRGEQREVGDTCDIGSYEHQPGTNSLVAVNSEPGGANCSHGGQRVESGTDLDDDGNLDSNEIRNTSYVCNGENSLVQATAEPAGTNCANGGYLLESGLDDGDGGGTAGNGALETGEVDSSLYVCNGEQALVEVSTEAPGANCEAGGQRIDSGMDDGSGTGTPGNGLLEADEIDGTAYVCNGVATLVNVTAEAPGGNCAEGGQRIDLGLDNGDGGGTAVNGTLESGEIDQTVYVCDGADGIDGDTPLVSVTAETAGANCANGGSLVEVGLDNGDGGGTADNGALEPGEVDQSFYVCNGADGTDGADGTNGSDGSDGSDGSSSLVTTTGLSEGDTDCPNGGIRIDVGLDNGDGGGTADNDVLEDGEIDDSVYVCNGDDGDDGAAGADGEDGADGGCSTGGTDGSLAFVGLLLLGMAFRRRRAA